MKRLGWGMGILALGILAGADALGAATINVPAGGSIQAAINAAAPGDTITVAAGVFHERLAIGKPLTLLGAQTGIDPTLPGVRSNPADETVIDLAGLPLANPNVLIEITFVEKVTISGFTLNGSSTLHYADEAVIRAWDDDLIFEDNIIDGYYGVLLKGNHRVALNHNRITTNKTGVALQPGQGTFVSLAGNSIIRGAAPAGDAQGIYMASVSDVTISGNAINGFSASNGFGGNGYTRLLATGNNLVGNGTGINIWGNSTFITIENNIVSNSVTNGIVIKGADITIANNQIQNNVGDGIQIAKHVVSTERVSVHNNCITGNANYGLEVKAGVVMPVDAQNNWWGAPTGPTHASNPLGTGDKVTDLVNFDPWLTDIAYTGSTSFADFDPVILKAAVATSAGPVAGVAVQFYADGHFLWEATTDAGGIALYDWGFQLPGSYSITALAGGGCLDTFATTVEVKHLILIADFQVTEAKLDWKKKPDDDKARVKGEFVLPDGATLDPSAVTLKIGNVTFGPLAMTKVDDKKWEFKRAKGADGIKDLKIEWKKKEAKFEVHIDDADLGEMNGWGNPVQISLFLGTYMGVANVPMVEHKDKWDYHK